MPSFIDKTGAKQEVTLHSSLYKAAKDANLTPRQYINQQYPTAEETDTFTQMCASEGLFFKADELTGVNSPPLSVVLEGTPAEQAANVTRENPVQSRVLFPPALMSYIEDTIATDRKSAVAVFDQMVALTTTVASARTEQPVISYAGNDGPEDSRAQQISQLAEPANMMTITASDITRQIPTFSLGLLISDQATQYATIDLVALAISRQKEIEMFALAGEAMLAMINGDVDNGQSALSAVQADSYDSTISSDGELTHKAWMLWLYQSIETLHIDWVIVDSIETAMAIENRSGKPVITGDDPNSPRIDTLTNQIYPSLAADVKMFIAPSSWGLAAWTVLGIQSDSAIAKLVNSAAEYESSERFALRRGEGFRMDFGQQYYRLFSDAFALMTLTT